jgi:hypothetical protein
MMKRTVGILLALGIVGQLSANESDSLVRFAGGIGVVPAASGVGPVNADGTFPNVKLNIVRGVLPGALADAA